MGRKMNLSDQELTDLIDVLNEAKLERITDRRVMHLLKLWLECAVEEVGKRGRKTRNEGKA